MNVLPMILAQANDDAAIAAALGGFLLVFMFIFLLVAILCIIGLWKVFEKAGKPGWASIVPIYNGIVLLEIIGKPIWWLILFFIPCVNAVMGVIVALEMAKVFGKGAGFGVGLAFLPFIFYPMLGFSDARYQPGAQGPPGKAW